MFVIYQKFTKIFKFRENTSKTNFAIFHKAIESVHKIAKFKSEFRLQLDITFLHAYILASRFILVFRQVDDFKLECSSYTKNFILVFRQVDDFLFTAKRIQITE